MTIDGDSSAVEVRVPEGTDLVIGTTSGKVTVEGRVGAVSVLTTSGRISIDQARSLDARTKSGRVDVGHAEGVCRIVSASGRVTVDRCGSADAASGSGRVVLADAHGHVRATSTSGKVSVAVAGAHDVEAETVSGRIEVSYPDGVRPHVVSSDADVAAGGLRVEPLAHVTLGAAGARRQFLGAGGSGAGQRLVDLQLDAREVSIPVAFVSTNPDNVRTVMRTWAGLLNPAVGDIVLRTAAVMATSNAAPPITAKNRLYERIPSSGPQSGMYSSGSNRVGGVIDTNTAKPAAM
jgi:hypothetical protein